MKIGDTVLANVNDGQWCKAQVIVIKDDIVVVSGEEERRRAAQSGRRPIGVGLPQEMVKESNR